MNPISTLSNETDIELWHQVQNNEKGAFEKIYKRFWGRLLAFCSLYLPDRSEQQEVLQNVFIELYVKRHLILIKYSVTSYLLSFTRNRIYNHLRNRSTYKRHAETAGKGKVHFDMATEEFVDFRSTRTRINQAIALLPLRYQQVFILRKEYLYSVKHTALILKRPVSTVEKQLRRAVLLLKESLIERT